MKFLGLGEPKIDKITPMHPNELIVVQKFSRMLHNLSCILEYSSGFNR